MNVITYFIQFVYKIRFFLIFFDFKLVAKMQLILHLEIVGEHMNCQNKKKRVTRGKTVVIFKSIQIKCFQ